MSLSLGSDSPTGVYKTPRFAFIDADNVYRGFISMLKKAGIPVSEADLFDLRALFDGYERCYVYYAQKAEEALPDWVSALRESEGFILRLSRTTQKGKETKQEGVDVQLAIEAIQHSYRGTMASCGLFSGDGDFLPLIDALTNNGTFVTVHGFGNPDKGVVTPELRNRADRYVRIGPTEILGCLAIGGGQNSVQRMSTTDKRAPGGTIESALEVGGHHIKMWVAKGSENDKDRTCQLRTLNKQGFVAYKFFRSEKAAEIYYKLQDQDQKDKFEAAADPSGI